MNDLALRYGAVGHGAPHFTQFFKEFLMSLHFFRNLTSLLMGSALALGACTTVVNGGGSNSTTDTTGGSGNDTTSGGGNDTGGGSVNDTTGGGGGVKCPVSKNVCCAGDSAATGHLYTCPDEASGMKCAGAPDPKCQTMECLQDPTCAQACAQPPKSDPSGCQEVTATLEEKKACCDKGGGGGGGGDTTGGGGGNDTGGGGGGVTGLTWAGTWQVKVEYDVDCDMGFNNHKKKQQQSASASMKVEGANDSLTMTDSSGNYQMTGTGHDDHATFSGHFAMNDADGSPTSGLGVNGIQVTFNITTVTDKDHATGNADGSKFGGEFSGDPNCKVSNSTVTMTR